MKAACLEEEIGSYVWAKSEAGKIQREVPDATCADHSMDCMRYASMFLWGQDLTPARGKKVFRTESLGSQLNHNAEFGEELGYPLE